MLMRGHQRKGSEGAVLCRPELMGGDVVSELHSLVAVGMPDPLMAETRSKAGIITILSSKTGNQRGWAYRDLRRKLIECCILQAKKG